LLITVQQPVGTITLSLIHDAAGNRRSRRQYL
jgi:hypothetical protein